MNMKGVAFFKVTFFGQAIYLCVLCLRLIYRVKALVSGRNDESEMGILHHQNRELPR